MRKWARRVAFGLLVLGGLLGVLVAFAWKGDIPLAELKSRWGGPPSRFVDVDGMSVHYRDEGSGRPLVLLHGTGASLHDWDAWALALSPLHRVVRLDLPGFGLTGPRPDRDYRFDTYVQFLDRFVSRLGLNSFALAGNSFGSGSMATHERGRKGAKWGVHGEGSRVVAGYGNCGLQMPLPGGTIPSTSAGLLPQVQRDIICSWIVQGAPLSPCVTGQVSQNGTCAPCPSGETACNLTCVSEQTDPTNCGGCATVCPSVGMICEGGSCACPKGELVCTGACVNEQTDPRTAARAGHSVRREARASQECARAQAEMRCATKSASTSKATPKIAAIAEWRAPRARYVRRGCADARAGKWSAMGSASTSNWTQSTAAVAGSNARQKRPAGAGYALRVRAVRPYAAPRVSPETAPVRAARLHAPASASTSSPTPTSAALAIIAARVLRRFAGAAFARRTEATSRAPARGPRQNLMPTCPWAVNAGCEPLKRG